MTPDQVASATLRYQELQTWITGLAIFLGPLAGVLFTLWFQARKETREAKLRLFLVLMSERKGLVTKDVTKALNQIDVVFASRPKVKTLWHQYYALLQRAPGEERLHVWLELLAAIASDLGYKGLSQVDLDKFYIPQGHVDDAEFQKKVAGQLSRVLENTEHLLVAPRVTRETYCSGPMKSQAA